MITVCGKPQLGIYKDCAEVAITFHNPHSDSPVHATIRLVLYPASGYFWFEPEWSY